MIVRQPKMVSRAKLTRIAPLPPKIRMCVSADMKTISNIRNEAILPSYHTQAPSRISRLSETPTATNI
jgi:hypothetical protein